MIKLKNTVAFTVAVLVMASSGVTAKNISKDTNAGRTSGNARFKTAVSTPKSTFFNINSWQIQMEHQGFFQWNGTPHGSAGDYPKGTGNVIFAEGILWGAKVSDKYGVDGEGNLVSNGSGLPRIRVNGSMYDTGMKAGKVLYDANGVVTGSDDWRERQIWRVRPDYESADLRGDAASVRNISAAAVSDGQIQATHDQYDYDWKNWPADEGAPYDDVDNDGVYTPGIWDKENGLWVGDIPGEPGADQTIWLVANDLPDTFDPVYAPNEVSVSEGGWGSPPIGLEMQLTMWGYNFPFSNPLSSMMFKRATIVYTGLPGGPLDAKIDTIYFTQWSDPDLGTYTDDYVGTDTTLNLGYVYNGNTFDTQFYNDYGMAVPAGGYDFLEGPKIEVDGEIDTLGLSSFVYFAAGSSVSDPNTRVYVGTLQWFNLMEGFLPRPEYPTQQPFVDPLTGLAEKFVLAGDPVTGTGWVDGIVLPPGDRRLVMTTGPFEMALGDTQNIVVGLIGGLGGDNLSSVTVLKYNDIFAQFAYDNNFNLPSPPKAPILTAFEGDGYINLDWSSIADYRKSEDPVNKGFAFEGYKIYQLSNPNDPGVLIAQFDVVNTVLVILEKSVDPATGLVLEKPAHVGTDNGIARSLKITTDVLRSRPITNDRSYYFGVSAYSYLPDHENSPFKSLESPLSVITVIPKKPNPGTTYTYDTGDAFLADHTVGTSTGYISIQVIDPGNTQDADYSVYYSYYNVETGAHFDGEPTGGDTTSSGAPVYGWGWNLSSDGADIITNQAHPDKTYAIGASSNDAPVVEGIQVAVHNPAVTAIADWDYSGDRWISGVNWGASSFFGGMGLGSDFFGSSGSFDYVPVELVFQDQAGVDANGYISKGAVYYRHDGYAHAGVGVLPFAAFEIDSDGNHVRQLNISFVEDEGAGSANLIWDMGWDGSEFGGNGGREYIFIHASTYNEGADYNNDDNWGPAADVMYAIWPQQRGTRAYLLAEFTLQIYPDVAANKSDMFVWSMTKSSSRAVVAADLKLISVFPNPYFGTHDLERSIQGKYITFNHLPIDKKIQFRIFNVGGVQVASFTKGTATQYQTWNMRNASGYPVASGVYIVHIKVDGVGEKILKLALVTEEEFIDTY